MTVFSSTNVGHIPDCFFVPQRQLPSPAMSHEFYANWPYSRPVSAVTGNIRVGGNSDNDERSFVEYAAGSILSQTRSYPVFALRLRNNPFGWRREAGRKRPHQKRRQAKKRGSTRVPRHTDTSLPIWCDWSRGAIGWPPRSVSLFELSRSRNSGRSVLCFRHLRRGSGRGDRTDHTLLKPFSSEKKSGKSGNIGIAAGDDVLRTSRDLEISRSLQGSLLTRICNCRTRLSGRAGAPDNTGLASTSSGWRA